MNFQFQYVFFVWLLAGLLIFLLLFLALKRWKKTVTNKIGDPVLVKDITKNYSARRFHLKYLLLGIAFILGVLAVMNLRRPGGDDGIQRKGIDVVFALDVSRSMLAKDIAPSRLERAKQFIVKMMDAMPENRVGLIVFAGKAYLQMPITGDHSAARMLVEEASPDIVPVKGTVISEALTESLNAFGKREAKYKAVILISDGEDHDEEAIKISKELATRGLMLNTIGLGSAQGTYIPDDSTGQNKRDENGQVIISKLNEAELKQLAQNTNGIYVHLENNEEAVKKVMAQLSQIDKKVTGDINLMNFSYYFWWFAGGMLLVLIVEQMLPEGRKSAGGKG